jgi:peptidoglycan/xylan/chitin deacetylase (PgdA/CDA1 family)
MRREIALNINFDSLAACLGSLGVEVDHRSFADPSFGVIMDRFQRVADEYHAPLTLYLVGQDLLSSAHRERARAWSDQGYEIGNHTWTHMYGLSNMSLDETRSEIRKGHNIVAETTGCAPRGFIAPGWCTSPFVIQVLTELDYRYDTSLAPSWPQLLGQLKLRLSSSGIVEVPLLRRRDLPGVLWGARAPYRATPTRPWRPNNEGLPMLPLPTGPFRLPVWHTMGFLLKPRWWEGLLRKAIVGNPAFYYLMHPLDLLDPDTDLVGLPDVVRKLDRVMVPLKHKMALLRRSLDLMAEQAQFVTMEHLAERVFADDHV